MPDTSYLDWPFFDESHRVLAREFDAWVGAEIGPLEDHGESRDEIDDLCRRLVAMLGEAGWLDYAVPANKRNA